MVNGTIILYLYRKFPTDPARMEIFFFSSYFFLFCAVLLHNCCHYRPQDQHATKRRDENTSHIAHLLQVCVDRSSLPMTFPSSRCVWSTFCLDWSVLATPAQQTFDTICAYLGGLFSQDQQDPQTPTILIEQSLPGMEPEFKIPTDTQTSPQILPLASSEQCTQRGLLTVQWEALKRQARGRLGEGY